MSKIIEVLQERIKPFRMDKPDKTASPSSSASKKTYQTTQQELADVYFADAASKAPKLPTPTLIRVVDRKRSFFLPWALTTLALLLASVALFSGKRIFVDITLMDEEVYQLAQSEPVAAPPARTISARRSVSVTRPEMPRDLSPLRFRFAGAAVLNSSRERHVLTLANSSLSGIAYAAIDFKPPVSAARHKLVFEARGEAGGEALEVIFKDRNNNTSLNIGKIQPFELGLSTHWQVAEVMVSDSPTFHRDRIAQMRFEFGSQRTANAPNMTVFIKNIQWVLAEEA